MKKEILNLGKALSRDEQKTVSGGNGSGCGYATYSLCAANCFLNNICVQTACGRANTGWQCVDPEILE